MLSAPAIRNPFIRVGSIEPDLDTAMKGFQAALVIESRESIYATRVVRSRTRRFLDSTTGGRCGRRRSATGYGPEVAEATS